MSGTTGRDPYAEIRAAIASYHAGTRTSMSGEVTWTEACSDLLTALDAATDDNKRLRTELAVALARAQRAEDQAKEHT